MARKDDVEKQVEPAQQEATQETPIQLITESQMIQLKLDRILELLLQK